jgi:hypothetical protein
VGIRVGVRRAAGVGKSVWVGTTVAVGGRGARVGAAGLQAENITMIMKIANRLCMMDL